MLQAIVYESNTGFTKRYAEILAAQTGIAAYSVAESRKNVAHGSSVVFLSWISGGAVVKLDKAKKYFDIRAVGAVGLAAPTAEREAGIVSHHELSIPVFCLPGGFDMSKLHGMQKIAMSVMIRSFKMQQVTEMRSNDDQMLQDMVNGCDHVSEDAILPLVEWVQIQQTTL